ncbi:hypothetical protein LX83_003648 [Goodfellowiella coeruleoviolacea]|uniref:Uncharacterized protein n=1 Tax=Goodfellowiella coeruleoviolacea TaxID=334858 RepID=A0AAE3KFW8_9PSEU|nr:hypothetical protein [Goodfellowiella coeruleoviolacea]
MFSFLDTSGCSQVLGRRAACGFGTSRRVVPRLGFRSARRSEGLGGPGRWRRPGVWRVRTRRGSSGRCARSRCRRR